MNIKHLKNQVKQNKILYYIVFVFYSPIWIKNKIQTNKKKKEIVNKNLKAIENLDINQLNIFYFGVPIHANLGDLAQTYCTEMWLKNNYPEYHVYEINTLALMDDKFFCFIKQKIKKKDIIFIQSGYCSHELHLDHKMHKKIIKEFLYNKIIVLPQTVNITSKKEMQDTASIFNNHTSLIFLARDEDSYNMIKNEFNKIHIHLYPDIVTSMIGKKFNRIDFSEKKGIFFCIRNDSEKYYSEKEINKLIEKLKVFEEFVDIGDTSFNEINVDKLKDDFNLVFADTVKKYSSYKIIITDRYHGTIFSAIANTQVIVLKTNDHKVKTGVNWFIQGEYKSVKFANTLNEAFNLVKEIYDSNNFNVNNNDYFDKHYYMYLKKLIEEEI